MCVSPLQRERFKELRVLRKKTHRGTRGGRRRQRRISVRVSIDRPTSRRNRASTASECAVRTNLTNVTVLSERERTFKYFKTGLKVLYFNAQSCRNKTVELCDFIQENDADMVFISETWFKETGDEPLVYGV